MSERACDQISRSSACVGQSIAVVEMLSICSCMMFYGGKQACSRGGGAGAGCRNLTERAAEVPRRHS
jgi:hypothetical protein